LRDESVFEGSSAFLIVLLIHGDSLSSAQEFS